VNIIVSFWRGHQIFIKYRNVFVGIQAQHVTSEDQ